MAFAEAGVDAVGVEIDSSKVANLRASRSHVEDVADARLTTASPRCRFTMRFAEPRAADAGLVCGRTR